MRSTYDQKLLNRGMYSGQFWASLVRWQMVRVYPVRTLGNRSSQTLSFSTHSRKVSTVPYFIHYVLTALPVYQLRLYSTYGGLQGDDATRLG